MARPADTHRADVVLPPRQAAAARRRLAVLSVALALTLAATRLGAPVRQLPLLARPGSSGQLDGPTDPVPVDRTPERSAQPSTVAPPGFGALLDLALPGVLEGPVSPSGIGPAESSGSAGRFPTPVREALGVPDDAGRRDLFVGFAGLWLALAGLAFGRGRWAWLARVAVAGGLLAVGWPAGLGLPAGSGGPALSLALALAAGIGLFRLGLFGAAEERGTPALFTGGLALASTAALGLLAIQAGAASDAAVLAPVLERLPAGSTWPGALVASGTQSIYADVLRLVLDRAAIAAFVALVVLLSHLRRRRTWTALAVLVVAVAEVLATVPASR